MRNTWKVTCPDTRAYSSCPGALVAAAEALTATSCPPWYRWCQGDKRLQPFVVPASPVARRPLPRAASFFLEAGQGARPAQPAVSQDGPHAFLCSSAVHCRVTAEFIHATRLWMNKVTRLRLLQLKRPQIFHMYTSLYGHGFTFPLRKF